MHRTLIAGALFLLATTAFARTVPVEYSDAPSRWSASLSIDDESTHLTAIVGVDSSGLAWRLEAKPYDDPRASWTANSIHVYSFGNHSVIVAFDAAGRPVGAWGRRDINGQMRSIAYQLTPPGSVVEDPLQYF